MYYLVVHPHPAIDFAFDVRPAAERDLDQVLALARAFGTTGEPCDSHMTVAFRRIVADPNVFLAVADDGAELVGYVLVQDYLPGLRSNFATGRINDLFVRPAARKTGVGRALMKAVENWVNSRPHPIILDWQAPTDSAGFYSALGYSPDYIGDIAEYPEFSIDTRQRT